MHGATIKNIQYAWKNVCSIVNLSTTNLKSITRVRTRSFSPEILFQGKEEEETTQIIYNGFFLLTDARIKHELCMSCGNN
jgi:hypothetical protein